MTPNTEDSKLHEVRDHECVFICPDCDEPGTSLEYARQIQHLEQTLRNIRMVAQSKGSATWEDTADGSKVYNEAYITSKVNEEVIKELETMRDQWAVWLMSPEDVDETKISDVVNHFEDRIRTLKKLTPKKQ